jgi:hypothetical protein
MWRVLCAIFAKGRVDFWLGMGAQIKRELKAQQLCTTASDVSVAGEIKKDLHEERKTPRLRRDQARVCRRIIEYSLDTTANRSANTIFGFTEPLKPLAETFANGES